MSDRDCNIYFSGSLKNGLRVYPVYDFLNKYYDNSQNEDLFDIIRLENKSLYIYVKYNLVTSMKNGRGGSFFCIAVEMENVYITNPLHIRTILQNAYSRMVAEKTLLDVNNHGITTFVPYTFDDVKYYLDAWIENIKGKIFPQLDKFIKVIPNDIQVSNPNLLGINTKVENSDLQNYLLKNSFIRLSDKYGLPVPPNKKIIRKLYEDIELLKNKIKNKGATPMLKTIPSFSETNNEESLIVELKKIKELYEKQYAALNEGNGEDIKLLFEEISSLKGKIKNKGKKPKRIRIPQPHKIPHEKLILELKRVISIYEEQLKKADTKKNTKLTLPLKVLIILAAISLVTLLIILVVDSSSGKDDNRKTDRVMVDTVPKVDTTPKIDTTQEKDTPIPPPNNDEQEKKKEKKIYDALMKKIDGNDYLGGNQYTKTINLLLKERKKFVYYEINKKIKDLEARRIYFVRESQVKEFIMFKPYNYSKAEEFLENAKKADDTKVFEKPAGVNTTKTVERWLNAHKADSKLWEQEENRTNYRNFTTPYYIAKSMLIKEEPIQVGGRTFENCIIKNFKYTVEQVKKIK